jgi:ligand-binding sensor domain-containing protein/signal transduction histidine kinase
MRCEQESKLKSFRKDFYLAVRSLTLKTLCLGCAIFIGVTLKAQQPYIPFQHLTNVDGLSQNHVLSIVQDKQGFIWFGTSEGLNRYDGYDFVIYRHDEKDSTSIISDNVHALIEDKAGEIWIGTGGGLCKYDRASDIFTSYSFEKRKGQALSARRINKIIEDSNGDLWLAFTSGLVIQFDPDKKKFSYHCITCDSANTKNTKNSYEATSLLEDGSGNIWIGTHNGLTVLDSTGSVKQIFKYDPADPFSINCNTINDLIFDASQNIWIATSEGICRYDASKNNFVRQVHDEHNQNSLSLNVVKCLNEDKEGRLWIGTENGGLDIWDWRKNQFYHFKQNSADKRSIAENSIYCIYHDKLSNMWVGTNSQGVSYYNRFMKPFIAYQSYPGVSTSLSYNKVVAVTEQPNSGYWIATDGGGLNFLDKKTNLFKSYRHDPRNANGIQSDFVVDVLWDASEKCLWVATWGGGLSRYDPETKKFKTYRHSDKIPTSISTDNLWRLYIDFENVLYVGTYGGGLSIFNKQTQTFENFSVEHGMAERNVISMFRDSKGFLWMGSWGAGLSKMDLEKRKFVPLGYNFSVKTVIGILGDSLDKMWLVGSPGIEYYDPKKNASVLLGMDDGLPGSLVNSLIDDQKGNFWLGTNKGIVKFNVAKKTFEVFTVKDGLPTNQYSSKLMRASDGTLFFGSVNGLVTFHPDSIRHNPIVPPVFITDLKVFNKSVSVGGKEKILDKHISETKEIWLPYEYNFISLHFVALNYTASQGNQYEYKLVGFDKDWIKVGSQRSATYTSLDAGTYTFRVKASNNDGLWNEEGTSLIIHVLPPWWETWWFKSLLLFAIISVAFTVYRLRVRAIQKQNKRLSFLVNERTKELKLLNEEINSQNKVLIRNEEEISTQRDMLAAQNLTLLQRQDEIETQNEELKQSQEEISAQRDLVFQQNKKLEEAQTIIEKQNVEIMLRNEGLEQEVESRTKELVAYNHQLEQFAFISAHNLRAPVARILGLGKILELTPIDTPDKKLVYEKMVSTARELDRVVRDLNIILEIKKNSNAIVSEILLDEELIVVKQHIEKEIIETGAEIKSDFSKAPVIHSVKPYVESIFYNLLSNAIKYRHPERKPIIMLTSWRDKDCVCIKITDNGLGIDLDLFKDKIFNIYQRFHSHVEGKGLGLYLIKTQIEAMGGKIEIESKVDEGTAFKIYFKILAD